MTTYNHRITATPPPGDEAYVSARIEGTDDLLVAPVEIETVTLASVDVDPNHPATQTLDTGLAPFVQGWLRVVFIDGSGQESAPSDLVAVPAAVTLTIDDLRAYVHAGGTGSQAGDEAFLQSALEGAIDLAGHFVVIPDPLTADLRDAILTLAARRYHERNTGYRDATVDESGAPMYFKQLPASVKVVFDSYKPSVRLQ